MTGNYSSSSESESGENFKYSRNSAWIYMSYLIGVSKYYNGITNTTTMSNWSGFDIKCSVSGKKLRLEVHNEYDGSGAGWSTYTRADILYLSGTLVYK